MERLNFLKLFVPFSHFAPRVGPIPIADCFIFFQSFLFVYIIELVLKNLVLRSDFNFIVSLSSSVKKENFWVLVNYPPSDFKILFSVEKKCGGGFWRAPDPPPTPFVNPPQQKKIRFPRVPPLVF